MNSRTRVVFLQHPREARVPVSTCRLAHLSLPNSELHVGICAEGSSRLEALAAEPGTMVLFPGAGATDVTELTALPATLIVVDGTWSNARKVVQRSPLLAALPRIGFTPPRPSNYRIRREPAAHCVSTIEAIAHVLEVLEEAPGRFTPMLSSFERMVDLQLAFVTVGTGRAASGSSPARRVGRSPVDRLRAVGERLVLLAVDGLPAPEGTAPLLHWVALRPATGERFSAVVRLPWTPHGLRANRTKDEPSSQGELLEAAVARWRSFAGVDPTLGSWGRFPVDLLRGVGAITGESRVQHVDLKALVSGQLHRPLGGVEHLAKELGAVLPTEGATALRKLAAVEAVVASLWAGSPFSR